MNKQYENNSINIKICGIKKTQILNFLVDNKINYFGLVFYKKSPRYINLVEAENLVNIAQGTKTHAVGVFVNYPINKIEKYINKLNLKYIQLHGNENDIYINKLKKNNNINIIKSIGINNLRDLQLIKKFKYVDYFLFDYKAKNNYELPGGNSKKFDWKLLKNTKISKKWFLSGGINEDNLKHALNLVKPYGIDISSGVEKKPGIKCKTKILKIINIIKNKT